MKHYPPAALDPAAGERRRRTTGVGTIQQRNPVMKRYRSSKFFQTLNQAKTVWDPKFKKGLLGGHLNVRSMVPKREQLEHLLNDSNIDFLGLTETWLCHSSPEAVVVMADYNVFRKDRGQGKGGGVLLYVKNTLNCSQIELPTDNTLECVGVNISLSDKMSFIVLCMYRKPSANADFYDQLKALLKMLNPKKEIILVGDLNVNWDNKKERKNLKLITDTFNLAQLIEQPTRITNNSKTKIDLLFTNKPERIVKTHNFVTGLSDHNVIFFTRKLTKHRFLNSHTYLPQKPPNFNFIPKNQQQNVIKAFKELKWDDLITSDNINQSADSFTNKISEVLLSFTRRGSCKNRKSSSLPWFNGDCLKLLKTRDQLLKRSLKSGLTIDRQNFTSARNKVTQALRRAKADFFLNIIANAKGNSRKVWQEMNKLSGRQNERGIKGMELNINNQIVKNPVTLATELNLFFINSVKQISSLFTAPDYDYCPVNPAHPVFNIDKISEIEVMKIMRALKNSKARDDYGIDTNFLKMNMESLVCPIMHLVNLSIKHSVVPSVWKVSAVNPIFKSGRRSDINNYRPISLLPVVSKIIEKWVVKQLIEHLNNSYTAVHPMQFGFRAHHSTETAITMFVEKTKCLLDRNACVGAIFLDLKRAFDTVDHRVLLAKLSRFNFSTSALKWMGSYLADRKQCVVVSGAKSPYLDCTVGVPQGSILGPILFSLYINDFFDICDGFQAQLYADDAVIFAPAKSTEEAAQTLSAAMVHVQEWLIKSCLSLNVKQTVCMMFTKQPVKIESSGVFLGGEELVLVTEFKYLGVILDPTLSFRKHIKKVCNSVKYGLANFRQIRNSLTDSAALMFFHSMILSHIDYCLPSWSLACSTALKPIESLYKKGLKILDKKPHSFHTCNILKKRKFLSLQNFKTFRYACFVYKTLHGLAPPPLKEFFRRRSVGGMNTRACDRGDCENPIGEPPLG